MAKQFFYPWKGQGDGASHEYNQTALEEFLNQLDLPEGSLSAGIHHNGSGPPPAGLGLDSDVYFDTANDDIWYKGTSGWELMMNGMDADETIALIEDRVRWRNLWVQQTYEENDMVRDGVYTMIANKDTNDKAAPVPVSPLTWMVPNNPVWSDLAHVGSVVSGIRLTPPAGRYFQASEIRVWLPDVTVDAQYMIIIVDLVSGLYRIGAEFNGTILPIPGWFETPVDPVFISEGDDAVVALVAQNSTASTTFEYPWMWRGAAQLPTDPNNGNMNRDNQHTILRVSKTPSGGPQGAAGPDLESVIVGTVIRSETDINEFNYFEWRVAGIVDNGTWMEYTVTLLNTGLGGNLDDQLANVTFTIPVALEAKYVAVSNAWSTQPDIQGYLQFDQILDGTFSQDQFGVDVLLQEYAASDDWDIVAISGGGGTSEGGAPVAVQQLESWPTGPTHLEASYSQVGTALTVPAGRGVIMDSYTDPENIPTITALDWPEQVLDFGSVTTRHVSYVYIDENSVVQFDTVPPDAALWRSRQYLGRSFHGVITGDLLGDFRPWHAVPNQVSNTLFDFIRAVGGAFLFNGGEIDTKYTDLTFAVNEQQWFSPGESWFQDRDDPNIANNPAQDPASFAYILTDGSVHNGVETTLVDPANYESSPGIVSAIPGSTNRASIQRFWISIAGSFYMSYGQEWYDNLEDAINNLAHDIQTFVPSPYMEDEAQIALVGYFILEKGASDLSDGTDVVVINDERLPIGGGGGSAHSHDATYLALSGGTMSGDINMDGGDVYGLQNPPPQLTSAVTKEYVDGRDALYLPIGGGTMLGSINMGTYPITNMADPTDQQDAVTVAYLEATDVGTVHTIATDAPVAPGVGDVWVDPDAPAEATYLPLAGGTMSGDIDMDGNLLIGVNEIRSDGVAIALKTSTGLNRIQAAANGGVFLYDELGAATLSSTITSLAVPGFGGGTVGDVYTFETDLLVQKHLEGQGGQAFSGGGFTVAPEGAITIQTLTNYNVNIYGALSVDYSLGVGRADITTGNSGKGEIYGGKLFLDEGFGATGYNPVAIQSPETGGKISLAGSGQPSIEFLNAFGPTTNRFSIFKDGGTMAVYFNDSTNYGIRINGGGITTDSIGIGYLGSTHGGGSGNFIGFRWSGVITGVVDNVVSLQVSNASDRRLKHDLRPVDDALSMILAMPDTYSYQPVDFDGVINWDADMMYGLVADEMEPIFPELVTGDGEDRMVINPETLVDELRETYQSIDYVTLVPLLVKALKELTAEVRGG
jgi:hypothetical protein